MYATSGPARPEPLSMPTAIQHARQRLSTVVSRLTRPETPTVEKANLYGQQDALSNVLEWLEGILDMELPDWERMIHLRTLATFLRARHEGERQEAARQEKRQKLNSLEWRSLTTGRLQGYQYGMEMLRSLGIKPIR